MKQKIKNCFFPLPLKCTMTAIMFGVFLSGCQASQAKPATIRIGVALYSQDDTFISTIVQQMEQLARNEEEEKELKINLNIADGRSNQTIQLEQIDRFIDSGCDVLCVNIVDRTAAAVLIDKVAEAEIPVIFFNRQPVQQDIQRWNQVYYVGPKGEQSGIYQGEILLEKWQEDTPQKDFNGDGVLQYVMLEGEPGHQDTLLRTEYAIKPLVANNVPLEKLASATVNWSRAQAAARMKEWCQEFGNQIEAVIANNDDMALGALDAAKELGIQPLPMVVGVDGTDPAIKALEQGELVGTVKNAPDMPQVLLQLSLALAQKEELPKDISVEDEHYVWLPYYKVTQDALF